MKSRFVTCELAELDTALGQVDHWVAMWKVERAREAAWVNAEALWALRDTARLSSKFLLTLDRMVGFAGRSLLRPIVIPAPIA
jgi:Family of unknown function (DUF5995)